MCRRICWTAFCPVCWMTSRLQPGACQPCLETRSSPVHRIQPRLPRGQQEAPLQPHMQMQPCGTTAQNRRWFVHSASMPPRSRVSERRSPWIGRLAERLLQWTEELLAHPEPLEWNVAVGRASNDDQCLSMLPHQCPRRLAKRLLQRTEELLRSPIQKHLSGVITGELLDSDLKGAHHDLIYKVLKNNADVTAALATSSPLQCFGI